MSMRDEIALYTELTGEDGWKVPIGQLGHFIWGYEIGIEKVRPKGRWEVTSTFPKNWICSNCGTHYAERLTHKKHNYCAYCGADMRGEE